MKKIIVFVISLITIIFVAPVIAYADDVNPEFFSFEHHSSVYNVNNKPYYLQLKAIWRTSSTSIDYYYYTYGFYLDNIDNVTLDISNGVYTLTFPSSLRFDSCYHVFRKNSESYSHQSYNCYAGSTSNPTQNYVKILVIDTVNNTLKAYHSKNDLYATYVFYDLNTNFDNLLSFGSDLQISIYPHIDYNFDYTVNFEGSNIPINLLQIDITNNSSKPYQYAVLIQPEDGFLEYDDHSNSRNLSIFWGDSPVTYALMKDEWYYAPFAVNQGYELINAPCAWHLVGANSFKREQIYYEQMQLKKGVNYTLKVLAFDLSDKSDPSAPWCTASSLIDVVFSKNFSVTSDSLFNPNQDANGCYSYDNTIPLDTQFDKVKAVYNKDTGQVDVIQNGQFGSVYKKNTSNGGSFYSSSPSVSTSFNNLFIYSSSYLVLCNRVFYYFPDWVNYCLLAGLSGLLLIFVLKKL